MNRMEFYPLSFTVEPGQREVHTSIQGKKMALTDVHVNIRAIKGVETGPCKRFAPPAFELSQSASGYTLSWDKDIEHEIVVVLEAQGNGGQMTRADLKLRTAEAPSTAIDRPMLGTQEQVDKVMAALGCDKDRAMAIVHAENRKALGEA